MGLVFFLIEFLVLLVLVENFFALGNSENIIRNIVSVDKSIITYQ